MTTLMLWLSGMLFGSAVTDLRNGQINGIQCGIAITASLLQALSVYMERKE